MADLKCKADVLAAAVAELGEAILEDTREAHQCFEAMSDSPLTDYSEPQRKKYCFHSRRILSGPMALTEEAFR